MAHDFDLVIALGSTQTGLTLTASVRDTAGSALGSQPAYTIVEQGGGWYSYHTSAMPDGQRGVVRILSGATVLAVGVVTPIETENADAKTSTLATPAQVNAEVLDVLATDTHAEPSAVPAATASLKDKVGWLFALARNKLTTTPTTISLKDDAGSGDIATAAHAESAGTYTRDEWS